MTFLRKPFFRLLSFTLLLAASTAAATSPYFQTETISWQADFDVALERAKKESLVTFLAINMDNEGANDRMANLVYRDKTVCNLSQKTINLVASAAWHNREKQCKRLGAIACKQHQEVDKRARSKSLERDSDGQVIAPQHLWLDPQGEILLAVPYEMTAGEMEWCFHRAFELLDPDYNAEHSATSRAPARLKERGVPRPDLRAVSPPPSQEQVLEWVKELSMGPQTGPDKLNLFRKLCASNLKEARKAVARYLKSRPATGPKSPLERSLNWIGQHSPPEYWDLVFVYAAHTNPDVSAEALVSIEQFGSIEALPKLLKGYKKAKDHPTRSQFLRAIGACAEQDSKARKLLLKAAKDRRSDRVQANALIAIGLAAPHEHLDAALTQALEKGPSLTQQAAALAMGQSGDSRWLTVLAPALASLPDSPKDAEKRAAIRVAINALKAGETKELTARIASVTGDQRPRKRALLQGR